MVKYVSTAIALKVFSSSSFTRSLYRQLGNRVGNKRRSAGKMPDYYATRLRRMLNLQRQHGIVKDGDRILELGTGWLHWEALTLRLFFDIKSVLYDVWDNRQLGGLKNYVGQLSPMLSDGFGLSEKELKRARSLIQEILKVNSFEELYKLLDFEYVIESSGSLAQFSSSSFDLIVSGGVLEHVNREALPGLAAEMHRVLKPDGWAVHSIDTADHLEHYDRAESPKLYLTFSEKTWRRYFENEVQYINRVQRGEWLKLFKANGFELVEEVVARTDISKLKLAERYAHMPKDDLECTTLKLALKRSAAAV